MPSEVHTRAFSFVSFVYENNVTESLEKGKSPSKRRKSERRNLFFRTTLALQRLQKVSLPWPLAFSSFVSRAIINHSFSLFIAEKSKTIEEKVFPWNAAPFAINRGQNEFSIAREHRKRAIAVIHRSLVSTFVVRGNDVIVDAWNVRNVYHVYLPTFLRDGQNGNTCEDTSR